MFITWHTPSEGAHNGTIMARNGHVHFQNIPVDRKAEHDDAVRELANALKQDPGTVQEATAFIGALGAKLAGMGNHIGFGPLPADWKSKLPEAVKAIAGAPKPVAEPKTLEELKAAHPEIMAEHAKEVLEPVKEAVAEAKAAIKGTDVPKAAEEEATK